MNTQVIFKSTVLLLLIALWGCGGGGSEGGSSTASESVNNIADTGGSSSTETAQTTESNSDENSSSNDSVEEGSSEVLSSQDLVAAPNFDFRTDQAITVSVKDLPNESGKLVFYHGSGFYSESTDTHYPNYDKRIGSMFAVNDNSMVLQVDGSWNMLTVEWLPMNAEFSEVYKSITLTGESNYLIEFN